jgi:hypothetical protein
MMWMKDGVVIAFLCDDGVCYVVVMVWLWLLCDDGGMVEVQVW